LKARGKARPRQHWLEAEYQARKAVMLESLRGRWVREGIRVPPERL
jgi:hypothetical protein